MEDFSKIISSSSVTKQKPLANQRSEPSIKSTNSDNKMNKRPADFFEGCITIDDDDETNQINISDDDDDIQEIERQQ